jgi:hypothetical protein
MVHVLPQCYFAVTFYETKIVLYRSRYIVHCPLAKQYMLIVYVKAEFCV